MPEDFTTKWTDQPFVPAYAATERGVYRAVDGSWVKIEDVDPTAQTEPLTIGQKIVADYETSLIAEPCELAAAIDEAIAAAVDLAELRAIFAQFFCAADQLSLGL